MVLFFGLLAKVGFEFGFENNIPTQISQFAFENNTTHPDSQKQITRPTLLVKTKLISYSSGIFENKFVEDFD